MIDIVPVLFVGGMVTGFISGVLSIKAYLTISEGRIEKSYTNNRPNVWRKVKEFRKNPQSEENEHLKKLFKWIYISRQTGLWLIILAFVSYVLIFALGVQ